MTVRRWRRTMMTVLRTRRIETDKNVTDWDKEWVVVNKFVTGDWQWGLMVVVVVAGLLRNDLA